MTNTPTPIAATAHIANVSEDRGPIFSSSELRQYLISEGWTHDEVTEMLDEEGDQDRYELDWYEVIARHVD